MLSQVRTWIPRFVLGLGVMLVTEGVRAQSKSWGFQARASARESNRWTLSEWLEQRDRNRMMDLWLSMNSPSPYEFMLGLSHLSTKYDDGGSAAEVSNVSLAGELHAYAQFVGLTLEHENNTKARTSDLTGLLNIRLLGNSLQNSSLTLHGGQLTRRTELGNGDEEFKHLVLQASLQIYLTKYFGIEGSYRDLQKGRSSSQDHESKGNLTRGGLFIDFKSVRIFGAFYQEKMDTKNLSTETSTSTSRTGIQSGLKIFY